MAKLKQSNTSAGCESQQQVVSHQHHFHMCSSGDNALQTPTTEVTSHCWSMSHELETIRTGSNGVQYSFSTLQSKLTVTKIAVAPENLAVENVGSYVYRQLLQSQAALWDL